MRCVTNFVEFVVHCIRKNASGVPNARVRSGCFSSHLLTIYDHNVGTIEMKYIAGEKRNGNKIQTILNAGENRFEN